MEMTEKKERAISDEKLNYIPTSYEDLYLHYMSDKGGASITKRLVRSFMPRAEEAEVESLVHDIFLRFVSSKMLEKFDASKANFGGAVFFVTRSVVVNYLDRKTRDPLGRLCAGTLVEVSEDCEPGTYNMETSNFAVESIRDEAVDAKMAVEKLIAWAEGRAIAAPKVNKRDSSLARLLRLSLEGYTPEECASDLGVSTSTIQGWLRFIKTEAPRMAV